MEEARQHSVVMTELEQLKQLLWDSWDPIGVNETDCPNDEYDFYAVSIFSMLQRGTDRLEINDFLHWAVTENMGLSANREHNSKIADAIFKIHEEFQK